MTDLKMLAANLRNALGPMERAFALLDSEHWGPERSSGTIIVRTSCRKVWLSAESVHEMLLRNGINAVMRADYSDDEWFGLTITSARFTRGVGGCDD